MEEVCSIFARRPKPQPHPSSILSRTRSQPTKEVLQELRALARQYSAHDLGTVIQARMSNNVRHGTSHPRLLLEGPEYQHAQARKHDRAGAHRARLERHVQCAVIESPRMNPACRLTNGEELRVRSGILIAYGPIRCHRDDVRIAHDDSTYRDVAVLDGVTSGGERLPEIQLVSGVCRQAPAPAGSRSPAFSNVSSPVGPTPTMTRSPSPNRPSRTASASEF
jgi:hypothetical protein